MTSSKEISLPSVVMKEGHSYNCMFTNCLVVNCILCTCTTNNWLFLFCRYMATVIYAWFLHKSCIKLTIHACMVHAWFIHSINHACHMHVTWRALFMHVTCMINIPISPLFHACLHVSCMYVVHAWNMHGKAWMNCVETSDIPSDPPFVGCARIFRAVAPTKYKAWGHSPHDCPQSWQWHSKPPLLATVYSQIETTAARYHNHCPGQLLLSGAACHKDPGARVSSLATLWPRPKLSRPSYIVLSTGNSEVWNLQQRPLHDMWTSIQIRVLHAKTYG